jgi:hypothetical protein
MAIARSTDANAASGWFVRNKMDPRRKSASISFGRRAKTASSIDSASGSCPR